MSDFSSRTQAEQEILLALVKSLSLEFHIALTTHCVSKTTWISPPSPSLLELISNTLPVLQLCSATRAEYGSQWPLENKLLS